MKRIIGRYSLLVSAVVLSFALTLSVALAGPQNRRGFPGISPANSNTHGLSLAEWMEAYWRWYYSGGDLSQSVVNGVQLMPLPASSQTGGSWTPDDPAVLEGSLEITLKPGTPVFLPLFTWVYERYDPDLTGGHPDDIPMDNSVAIGRAHPTLTIDSREVVNEANKNAYFVPTTAFDPILVYPAPSPWGSIAGLFFHGVGVLVNPLPVGTHVIHLYEPIILFPGDFYGFPDGLGLIYDNTWIITVQP